MKKILIKNFLLIFVLCISAVSCKKDFLELAPQQSVSNEEALLTIGDFQSSITAVYNGLQDPDYYGRYFFLVPDVMSDDVKQHPSANRAKDYAEYTAIDGDFIAEEMWQEMWQEINNLNAIINAVVELPSTVQDDYNHIIGEALALRGIVYFDMVRAFAQHYSFTADASHLGVPIVLEFDQLNEPSRNSVKQVYDQVISDMTKAIGQMSDESRSGSSSTLSQTSVKALLARVYLYKDDLVNAEQLATEVINSNKYSLVDNANYAGAWAGDGLIGTETIFSLTMDDSDNNGSDALGGMYNETGYGDYLPSGDLVSLIPDDDVRRGWFVEDTFLDGDYAPYRMAKYPDNNGADDAKVMRLAEVYLIRAEARARQNNNDAQGDIDIIRQRSQPSAANVTATGQALIDEAMLERRKELCFEGQRTWDLMRHKQDIVRTNCTSSICLISYPSERVIMPIPEAEMDANPNIEPNPGY